MATVQGKQGIWFLLFPDRENTGNFVIAVLRVLVVIHASTGWCWENKCNFYDEKRGKPKSRGKRQGILTLIKWQP